MGLSGLWKILLNVLDQQWEFIQREKAKTFQENIPYTPSEESEKMSAFL